MTNEIYYMFSYLSICSQIDPKVYNKILNMNTNIFHQIQDQVIWAIHIYIILIFYVNNCFICVITSLKEF